MGARVRNGCSKRRKALQTIKEAPEEVITARYSRSIYGTTTSRDLLPKTARAPDKVSKSKDAGD